MNQLKNTVVKLGAKQKHLRLPDQWEIIKDGPCLPGDMCADISNENNPKWMLCTEEHEVGDDYSTFEALIRRIK